MKNALCSLAVFLLFPAACVYAGSDCGKSPDACRSQPASLTPFMAELKQAARPAEPAQAPAATNASSTVAATEKPAKPAPTAAPSATPPAAAGEPARPKEVLSKPGWLIAAVLFLYGLYFFLKPGNKKKRYK